MTTRLKIIFLALLFYVSTLAAEEMLSLNLNNADIRALISTVSEMTGKNFIVDPRVKGKVTVVSASPSSREHIYEIFLSVLKVHGFTAVPSGEIIKIVPDTVAKQDNIRTVNATGARSTDEPVTRVLELKHIAAAQLIPVLRPLMPQQAHLAAHAGSNTLIISDSSANVSRIAALISRIDRVGDPEIEVISLEYANAADLVKTLNSLRQSAQGGQAQAGPQPTMVADQRTNSILLGGDPVDRLEIRTLIAHLDTPIANEGNTEVIYLRYAQAKDMVAVLKGVGAQHKEMAGDGKQSPQARADTSFDIQADESTNAMVVTAPPALMRSLKSVINQLDIRRAQVYIEAIIAELTDDKAVDFGVEWQTGTPSNIHTKAFGGTSLPINQSTVTSSFPTTLGSGFSLGFFRNGDLRALIKAFASNSDTNILSTPTLVTLDNEEASIHVGENVPFVTGQYDTTSGSATTPFQTIERHDVGIKLNVLPQINEGDTIKLKIEQEVSSVNEDTSGAGLQTRKRNINTTVLVDDKQTIVLGGLIKDDLTEYVAKVPILGDIPVLGLLFRNTHSSLEKTNLMVFLRPEIIRDQRTGGPLTYNKYNYIRDLQKGIQEEGVKLMPKQKPPMMPPLKLDTSKYQGASTAGGKTPAEVADGER